jgi:hypothetical protein
MRIALTIAGLAIVALSAAAVQGGSARASSSCPAESVAKIGPGIGLEPLPPGTPRQDGGIFDGIGVSLDEMLADAPLVFVGRVSRVGGSEHVGGSLTVHRTRFEVLCALRGDMTALVDIAQFDGSDAFPFEVGETHLVFAHELSLGPKRYRALVPYGYDQGMYPRIADDVFRNRFNGSIELDDLVPRLNEVPTT